MFDFGLINKLKKDLLTSEQKYVKLQGEYAVLTQQYIQCMGECCDYMKEVLRLQEYIEWIAKAGCEQNKEG